MKNRILTGIISAALAFTGCKKSLAPEMQQAAYLRFENGFTNSYIGVTLDAEFETDTIPPFGGILTVLRPLPVSSGAVTAANDAGDLSLNYKVGNKLPLQTAPVMNGFDLSPWIRVPAGRHRLTYFVSKEEPGSGTSEHTTVDRSKVLKDTMIELKEGEIYTVQNYTHDRNVSEQFGVTVIKENIAHADLSDMNKIHLRFHNMLTDNSILPEEFDIYVKFRFQKFQTPGRADSPRKDTTTADETFIGTVNHKRFTGDLGNEVTWFSFSRPEILNNISPLGEVRSEPWYIYLYYRKGENAEKGGTPLYIYNSFLDGNRFYRIPKGGAVSIQLHDGSRPGTVTHAAYVFKRKQGPAR